MRVIETIASLGSGGAETLIKDLSIGLKHKGAEVLVIVTDSLYNEPSENFKIQQLKDQGIEVKSLNRVSGKKHIVPFFRFIRLAAEFKPTAVHFHSFISGIYLLPYLLFSRKVNFFQTIHNTKSFLGKLSSLVQKYIFGRFCRLIYCSEEAETRLQKVYGNGVVINNGVSLPLLNNIRENVNTELNLPKESIVMLNVGRIVEQKNQVLLLDLVELLNKNKYHGNFHLLICGANNSDTAYQELMQKHNEMEFKEQVRFLGVRNDIVDFMHSCDVYISSSIHEGLPITGLEALAVGVPMVLSPIKEHLNVFKDANNVYFPLENSALSFEQLIKDLTFCNNKEHIKLMRKGINNKYSIGYNVTSHLKIFDSNKF